MSNSSKSLMAGGPFKSTLGHFTISVAAPTSSTSPVTAIVTITSTQNWKGGVNITYSIQSGSSVAISPSSEQVSIPSNGSVQRGVTLQAYQSELDPNIGDLPPAAPKQIRSVTDELKKKLNSLGK